MKEKAVFGLAIVLIGISACTTYPTDLPDETWERYIGEGIELWLPRWYAGEFIVTTNQELFSGMHPSALEGNISQLIDPQSTESVSFLYALDLTTDYRQNETAIVIGNLHTLETNPSAFGVLDFILRYRPTNELVIDGDFEINTNYEYAAAITDLESDVFYLRKLNVVLYSEGSYWLVTCSASKNYFDEHIDTFLLALSTIRLDPKISPIFKPSDPRCLVPLGISLAALIFNLIKRYLTREPIKPLKPLDS